MKRLLGNFRRKAFVAYRLLRQGQLLTHLKYKRGGYRVVRTTKTHLFVQPADKHITFKLPQHSPELTDYLYTINAGTELTLKPYLTLRGGVFVDIGAFIGKYTLSVATEDEKNKVVAIEPNPISRAVLIDALKENGVSARVTVVPKAIATKEGTLRLSLQGAISRFTQTKTNSAVVRTAPIPAILKSLRIPLREVKLIKVDVEGAEQPVLEQLKEIAPSCHPSLRIVCESKAHSPHTAALLKSVEDVFKVTRIDPWNVLLERRL